MRKNRLFFMLSIFLALLIAGEGFALKDKCESLTEEQMKLAKKIMSKTYCYDCCDETVDKCLKKKKVCKLAVRLSNEICSRVKKEQSEEKIKSALDRRAKSMMPSGKKYTINTSDLDTWAGDKESKVVLVAYMCARCPFCAIITPKLYKSVTKGKLKGKVKFNMKIFPIKSHKGGVEGGLAMAASAKMGKFWPYLLKLYNDFDDYSVKKLVPWAKQKGMNGAKFKAIMNKDETRKLVVSSKKEGLKNGVVGTPTFYINGRKYTADYKMEFFTDALEEEHDKMTDDIYVK